MLRTTVLLGALTGIIMAMGQWLGGMHGMTIAFVIAVVMNFGSYWFSDKIVLAAYSAREVTEAEAPMLYRIVHNLTLKARMPMPRVYLIPQDSPNAFATGRNPQHAAVAVTEGLMRLMNEREITGVLAHELGHVQNRDILISSIAATLAGVIIHVANMAQWAAMFGGFRRSDDEDSGGGVIGLILMAILAPLAATVIQMAISRTREFAADETGAKMAGDPLGLAGALRKLGMASERIPLDASPQTSHLFIVNPLSGAAFARLFSTHPPLEERIERLERLAGVRA
ncbi:MAG: zinc metalloprotease HtpX [Deltaproteobacteria bacterium]|nr:zinc metalloprotease HtpX [Deltaproteobacteria bacterium]